MSKLSLLTQNAKGGTPLWKENLGYAALFMENEEKTIIADAFEGMGSTYKRRDKTHITISKGAKRFEFNSFNDLFTHLEKTMK
jgi:hypothetical protein